MPTKNSLAVVSPSVVEYAFLELARGRPLATIAKESGIDPLKLQRSLTNTPDKLQRYLLARESCADSLAAEVIEIVDNDPDPVRANNRANARKWLASKLFPRVYGERLDVNLTAPIDLGAALAEARARALRPVSDQARVVDAEVIEVKKESAPVVTDKESADAPESGNVDIFE